VCNVHSKAVLAIQGACRSHLAKLQLEAAAATRIQRWTRRSQARSRWRACGAAQQCAVADITTREVSTLFATSILNEPAWNQRLEAAILQVHCLTALDLRASHLGAAGVRILASALVRRAAGLQRLSLAWNAIGDDGVVPLVYALRVGRLKDTLLELDVSHNRISCSGACLLEPVLRRGTTLQLLDLRGNCVGREAAERLVARATSGSSAAGSLVQRPRVLFDISWSKLSAHQGSSPQRAAAAAPAPAATTARRCRSASSQRRRPGGEQVIPASRAREDSGFSPSQATFRHFARSQLAASLAALDRPPHAECTHAARDSGPPPLRAAWPRAVTRSSSLSALLSSQQPQRPLSGSGGSFLRGC